MLKHADASSNIKIGVLNLILNLAYRENEQTQDGKARKQIVDMNLVDMLKEMRERERDTEVKVYLERAIGKL